MLSSLQHLEDLERRLLEELVNFHLQHGIQSEQYMDPETGGIYEHKLASRIGISSTGDHASPEVVAACGALAEKGLVRLNLRKPDYPVRGVRPTQAGLALVRYWQMTWKQKTLHWLKNNWPSWALPIALTILTSIILRLMGLL